MNYCDWLFAARSEWLHKDALVDGNDGRRLTYGQLQAAVRALAGHLRALGYGPGDVIATHLYNGAEAVIAHLSIQYIGATTCLLDPMVTAEGLKENVLEAVKAGVSNYVVKPFTAEVLQEKIETIFKKLASSG